SAAVRPVGGAPVLEPAVVGEGHLRPVDPAEDDLGAPRRHVALRADPPVRVPERVRLHLDELLLRLGGDHDEVEAGRAAIARSRPGRVVRAEEVVAPLVRAVLARAAAGAVVDHAVAVVVDSVADLDVVLGRLVATHLAELADPHALLAEVGVASLALAGVAPPTEPLLVAPVLRRGVAVFVVAAVAEVRVAADVLHAHDAVPHALPGPVDA